MSSLNDISNLNESLTQGGKYTSNKSDLLGSFTELKENANEVIHSTIEQFLPGHFDAVDDGTDTGNDVAFVDTGNADISLNILIDNFKVLAGDFDTALTALTEDTGYRKTIGGSGTYDLSFGYATEAVLNSEGATALSAADANKIYFVSRVDGKEIDGDGTTNKRSHFQYSELITDVNNAANPSKFEDENAPEHLRLTCGNLPELTAGVDFFSVDEGEGDAVWTSDGNTADNTASTGDRLAIDDQTKDDIFGDDLTTLGNADLLAARKRMCNPYNIIEDQDVTYNGNSGGEAGQKFATVTYHATKIKALVEEINKRIMEGEKITDADGNEIALTLAELNEKYDSLLKENANVDAHLETESLKFDTENMVYIGMLVATITFMAVGFTSLAKRTDTV